MRLLLTVLTVAIGSQASAAAPLTLSDYLTQVGQKHLGIKAADKTAKASREEAKEGELVYAPTLIGNASDTADQRNNPFAGDQVLRTQYYSLGVSKQTDIGLTGKLSYNYSEFDIPGSSSVQLGYAQIDLSQSLLRNWNGTEFKEQAQLAETNSLAKSFTQSYMTKSMMLEAETNYWRLALARELVNVQKDAVDRAQRIWDWTSRREKLQLVDRSDALNAQTNLQARKVDLLSAQDDERAAAQSFNSSRGDLSDAVGEPLAQLVPELVVNMAAPQRTGPRDDVKAADYQAKATAANALLNREKDKPTVELYGSTVLTDTPAIPAQYALAIPATSRPSTIVGLRLTAPLDLKTLSKIREGYAAEAQAADWLFQRKAFEEDRDWRDLTAKYGESQARLRLYVDLEKTQKEKLDNERERQKRGRSTLEQVLLFEADYQNSQLGRIRTLADLLTLNAQMKLYGVSYESR